MKNIIRLNEENLHRLIEGCVREVLNEVNSFSNDYQYGSGYAKGSVNMPNPAYDDVASYQEHPMYTYSVPDRDSNQMYRDLQDFNNKEGRYMKDADRCWMKAADTRPLHRKGSLNREF